MKKLFVVSDVHSFYNEFIQALNKAEFDINNENHILISLGDITDRGSDPEKCLDFVNNLPDNRKILVRGNHEDMIFEILKEKRFRSHDYHNGTVDTFFKLAHVNKELYLDENGLPVDDVQVITKLNENEKWQKYRDSLVDYYEIGNYIFVHGWIPIEYEYISNWKSGDWSEARWLNGFKEWRYGNKVLNKTIVCGHIHTSYAYTYFNHDGHEYPLEYYKQDAFTEEEKQNWKCNLDPFYGDGIIGIDGCTAISGKVNVLVLEV